METTKIQATNTVTLKSHTCTNIILSFKTLPGTKYAVPFIFGTTGNVILLITIICYKDMRTVPNMYILNLAISDTIYLTVLFSEACANRISDT